MLTMGGLVGLGNLAKFGGSKFVRRLAFACEIADSSGARVPFLYRAGRNYQYNTLEGVVSWYNV